MFPEEARAGDSGATRNTQLRAQETDETGQRWGGTGEDGEEGRNYKYGLNVEPMEFADVSEREDTEMTPRPRAGPLEEGGCLSLG